MRVSRAQFGIARRVDADILAGGLFCVTVRVYVLQVEDGFAQAFELDILNIKRNRQAVIEQPYRFFCL